MDRPTRSIITDLLPLYEEGLLSEETTDWLEEQVNMDPELEKEVTMLRMPLEKEEITSSVPHDEMLKKVKRRLSLYQLVFLGLSFFLAIQTSILNDSFGFTLWYAVLGVLTYCFYKDMRIVFYISFLPIFVWSIGLNLTSYQAGHIFANLAGSLSLALIHYLFALIGSIIGLLAIKIKEGG